MHNDDFNILRAILVAGRLVYWLGKRITFKQLFADQHRKKQKNEYLSFNFFSKWVEAKDVLTQVIIHWL